MWNDIETTQDFLNFKVVADTAAQMIKVPGMGGTMVKIKPISIKNSVMKRIKFCPNDASIKHILRGEFGCNRYKIP